MTIFEFFRENQLPDRMIHAIFILALSIATINHVTDLVVGGMFPYSQGSGAPALINIYWTSLTLLDPLAICILASNVRAGYVVAILIMLTDVPINLYAAANGFLGLLPGREYNGLENIGIPLQIAFLVFLLITARRIWRLSAPRPTPEI